jgi:hypothetical protein
MHFKYQEVPYTLDITHRSNGRFGYAIFITPIISVAPGVDYPDESEALEAGHAKACEMIHQILPRLLCDGSNWPLRPVPIDDPSLSPEAP